MSQSYLEEDQPRDHDASDMQSIPLLTAPVEIQGASADSESPAADIQSPPAPTVDIQSPPAVTGLLQIPNLELPEAQPGSSAEVTVPAKSPRGEKKVSAGRKVKHKEQPSSINIEEFQQQMRQKVEQIMKQSCDQVTENIMQSLLQLAGQQMAGLSAATPGPQGNGSHGKLRVDFASGLKADGVEGSWGLDMEPPADTIGNGQKADAKSDAEVEAKWLSCPHCNNLYQQDAEFCRKCGRRRIHFPPPEELKECKFCGNLFQHDATFCRKCGRQRQECLHANKGGLKKGQSLDKGAGSARKSRRSMKGRQSRKSAFPMLDSSGTSSFDDDPVGVTEKPRGIFANSDDMKQKLRDAIAQPDYDVAKFYHKEGFCQAVARSSLFEHMTLFVIAFNAVWISIDCDNNDATVLVDADPVFQVVDNLFCFYFTFEWAIRFGAFRRKRDGMKDGWFVFDSILVITMVAETWVISLLILFFSESGSSGVGDASLLKVVRLVRLVRMARVIHILHALPELMVLIKGIFVASRAVSCTVMLMLIIIYVFAVVFRQLTSDSDYGRYRFPSVPTTMRFLLLQSTVPDLYDASEEIWAESWLYAMLFLFFLLIVTITVMNMLVGVLVSVVNTVATVEKEQLMVIFVKKNLMHLLKNLSLADEDDVSDSHITLSQFRALMHIPEALRSFDSMGVDVVGLNDLKDFIFGDGTPIPFVDFMELVMQLRGSNQATVKDIVDLRKFILIENKRLESLMRSNETIGEVATVFGKTKSSKFVKTVESAVNFTKDDSGLCVTNDENSAVGALGPSGQKNSAISAGDMAGEDRKTKVKQAVKVKKEQQPKLSITLD